MVSGDIRQFSGGLDPQQQMVISWSLGNLLLARSRYNGWADKESDQIIATSHDLDPQKGSVLEGEIPLLRGHLAWWNITLQRLVESAGQALGTRVSGEILQFGQKEWKKFGMNLSPLLGPDSFQKEIAFF